MKITSESEYGAIMRELDILMKVGEENLSDPQLIKLRELAVAAEEWEQRDFG